MDCRLSIPEKPKSHHQDHNRRKNFNKMEYRNDLKEKCKEMGNKPITRGKPFEVDFNETLKVIGAKSCKQAPPKKKFRLYPTILPKKELQRLKSASKVISLEERVAEQERLVAEHMRVVQECEQRKKLLKDIDHERIKARHAREMEKPKDLEELDAEDRHKVLERAFLAKHEHEEEVKKANRLILEAKCHVILDAQVAEKNELAREIKEEERRLEQMMLNERDKSFQADEDRLQKQEELKKKYADEIRRQLEEREFLRQKEAERIDEEAKIRTLTNLAIEQEEKSKAEVERLKKTKLREDLQRISDMSKFFKRMQFESERQAEIQIQEFMRAKEERENKIALEKKFAKETMERLQEKLYDQQAKILTTKSEQDDMLIRREQEKKEREYRKKEKEAAIRKKQIERELAEARRKQLEDLKHRHAMQIAQDEYEFKKTVEKLKTIEEEEKELEKKRLHSKEQYREEIIRQMNIKEMERRELERRAKNEYLAWIEKEQNRDKTIRTIIKAKLDQMREAKLPEKYIKDVEKQLKIGVN